jgi:hypothetical protein
MDLQTASVTPEVSGEPAQGWADYGFELEEGQAHIGLGTDKVLSLFARGGAIGIAELSDTGEASFVELKRIRTHRT